MKISDKRPTTRQTPLLWPLRVKHRMRTWMLRHHPIHLRLLRRHILRTMLNSGSTLPVNPYKL